MKVKREYYKLADAVKQSKCTTDDLIHRTVKNERKLGW
jgi:hypothetical protein